MLGARLINGSRRRKLLAWQAYVGNDFPEHAAKALLDLDVSFALRRLAFCRSERAVVRYMGFPGKTPLATQLSASSYEWKTAQLRFEPRDDMPVLMAHAKAYHFLAGAQSFFNQTNRLRKIRRAGHVARQPFINWELDPLRDDTSDFEAVTRSAASANVVSLNQFQLANLCGHEAGKSNSLTNAKLQRLALRFMKGVEVTEGVLMVVRAGDRGYLIVTKGAETCWLPPFHEAGERDRIVDPTGAGSAFLGALAIGYLENGDMFGACCFGVVGASFAVEQVGLPTLDADDRGQEMRNPDSVSARLASYQVRTAHLRPARWAATTSDQ